MECWNSFKEVLRVGRCYEKIIRSMGELAKITHHPHHSPGIFPFYFFLYPAFCELFYFFEWSVNHRNRSTNMSESTFIRQMWISCLHSCCVDTGMERHSGSSHTHFRKPIWFYGGKIYNGSYLSNATSQQQWSNIE